jgi:hypothetical protein
MLLFCLRCIGVTLCICGDERVLAAHIAAAQLGIY